MIEIMQEQNWPTVEAFVNAFNHHRLVNRGRWVGYKGTVCGKNVTIKNWDLWPQQLVVDGVHFESSYPEKTVKAWKLWINTSIYYQSPAHLTGAITEVTTW